MLLVTKISNSYRYPIRNMAILVKMGIFVISKNWTGILRATLNYQNYFADYQSIEKLPLVVSRGSG